MEIEEGLRECRRRVAEALKRNSLPDAAWGDAVQSGLPFDAIREGYRGDEWDELVVQADAYLKRERLENGVEANLPFERSGRGDETKEVGVELDDYSRLRAETWSEVTAALAARRASVRRFRAEYLEGRLLPREEADEWMYGDSSPPDALKDLQSIAKTLHTAYRWRKEAAIWFVLTGDVPNVSPVNVRVSLRRSREDVASYIDKPYLLDGPAFLTTTAEITIVAEPWVDADVVEAAYRTAQRQLRGGDNRKKDVQTLDAIRFASRRISEAGSVRWEEIRRLWNKKEPGRGYKTRGGLPQAFRRFLRPEYGRPNFKSFEPEPWQEAARAAKEREAGCIRRPSEELGPPREVRAKKA